MQIKRLFLKQFLNFLMKQRIRISLEDTFTYNCNINPIRSKDHIDIVTIAFNNVFVIENQIRLIKKNLIDRNYTYTIADNSSNSSVREYIHNMCKKENVSYISLPKDYIKTITKRPSYSHGAAMNWIYSNYIIPRNSTFFGFIDHDIFPTKFYSILEKIGNQDFYGHIKEFGDGYWYLWAGFCFFKTDSVASMNINFFPTKLNGIYLDTGGSNYLTLYKNYSKKDIVFGKPIIQKSIREGDDYHSDYIHFIDEIWLHTINASYWKKVVQKEDLLAEILKTY